MEPIATRIVAEGLSVRMVEEIVTLGEQPTKAREGPADRQPRRGSQEVAESLCDSLDTRVQVTMGRSKGRVTIEFAGREDLNRILDVLDSDGTST